MNCAEAMVSVSRGNVNLNTPVSRGDVNQECADVDEIDSYVDLRFPNEMASIILDEKAYNSMEDNDIATLSVYVAHSIERVVIIKEDDILTKKELEARSVEAAKATMTELTTWLSNNCFENCMQNNA